LSLAKLWLIPKKTYIYLGLEGVGMGGMDLTDLAQDRDRWWALVNAVMNLRVP
jgi:hypothetical protein